MVENARKKCFTFYENKQKSLENIGLYLYNDRRYVTFYQTVVDVGYI